MTAPDAFSLLSFYATPPHPCSYLDDREATTVFADPAFRKNKTLYSSLSRYGFRRSGDHVYRPRCANCAACVPVRVPVQRFRANRSQKRTLKANQGLNVRPRAATFHPDHFSLYRRYLAARHAGGGMDNPTPDQYMEFLTSSWADTTFYEYREGSRILAVSVLDALIDGRSAVYTFYEPGLPRRSLGTYAVLWSIEETRRTGGDWLYLGYWIRESAKMRYKAHFQPLQYQFAGRWTEAPPA